MLTKLGKFLKSASTVMASSIRTYPLDIAQYNALYFYGIVAVRNSGVLSPSVRYINPLYTQASTAGTTIYRAQSDGRITGAGIFLGKGTGVVTEDDYTLFDPLSSEIQSSIMPSSNSVKFDTVNKKAASFSDYSIQNMSGSELTITEWGIFSQFNASASAYGAEMSIGSSNIVYGCISHDLLASPLVIPAGEAGALRLEYIFDFSDFVEEES